MIAADGRWSSVKSYDWRSSNTSQILLFRGLARASQICTEEKIIQFSANKQPGIDKGINNPSKKWQLTNLEQVELLYFSSHSHPIFYSDYFYLPWATNGEHGKFDMTTTTFLSFYFRAFTYKQKGSFPLFLWNLVISLGFISHLFKTWQADDTNILISNRYRLELIRNRSELDY